MPLNYCPTIEEGRDMEGGKRREREREKESDDEKHLV